MVHRVAVGFAIVVCFTALTVASMSARAQDATASSGSTSSTVVAHPAPAGEPLSEDFELTAGGQKVSVYVCRVSAMPFNQVWPGYQRPVDQTELASFATWDMTGPVDVEVVSRRPVETVAIRPTARGIQAKVDGNRIRFRLPSPQQIIVEVNGWHKALHLFANATDAAATNPQTPGVRYFGPGVHRPGMIHVESNQTVYIADGAVVYGAIEAKDASNFKILGRGIIDSSEIPRTTNRGDNHYARIKNVVQAGGCLRLVRCKNATIEGVILRDPNVWCLTTFLSSDIAISNVKLIGLWRYNADGIDICNSRRVTVRNCFVRAFDDSLVVKGLVSFADVPIHDILFEGCVVWNDWGRALEIGAETSSPELTRVTFRDCDVVRTAEIALDVQHSDRAPVSKVLFENIRFEVDDVNLAPRIQKTPDDKYVENTQFCPQFLVLVVVKSGNSHDAERGTMADVVVRDCSISGKPLPLSRLQGFDAQHDIRNVTISNLRINGRVATSLEDAGVRVGKFVQDVRIGSQ